MAAIIIRALTPVVLIFLALAAVNSPAKASCTSDGMGGQLCAAGIPWRTFVVRAADTQHASMWCWAATEEMIFTFYQHRVRQETIVRRRFNSIIDVPSGPPENIIDDLNNTWTDTAGSTFSSSAEELDSSDVEGIARALDSGEPIAIGTSHHMMVLTGIAYTIDAGGNYNLQENVQPGFASATVQDPWPPGYEGFPGGRRLLTVDEWSDVQHLWAVSVSD